MIDYYTPSPLPRLLAICYAPPLTDAQRWREDVGARWRIWWQGVWA